MMNRLKITDLTLRDGHQSLIATRMRTDEMKGIASEMNKVGFSAMEVWGGATFDVMIRYLDEDPWERLRILKPLLCDTPLRMLLRGQSLVGYRPYPDDVVFAFVHHAAQSGIDIFLVFDPLNDERNLATPFKAIRETGKQIHAQLLYALTEPRLGGEIYNIDYYVNKALAFQEMGAECVCIEDMSGILNPYDADILIGTLKARLKIPVELDCHFTGGMACMSYLKAIEAGVKLTIGTDVDTAASVAKMGGEHVPCQVREIAVDKERRIVTTPAYMLAGRISEAADGIEKLVKAVLDLC